MSEQRRLYQRSRIQNSGCRCLFQTRGKLTCCCFMIVVFFMSVGATTMERYPLAPPNTDSPQTILRSFINSVNKAYHLHISGASNTKEIQFYIKRAIRCLDLNHVAPSVLEDVGIESVLLLKEVLDRIEIPPFADIPDRAAMKGKKFKKWVIPYTEITIALVEKGSRQGEYLFTADTVDWLKSFYERVEHLPYKPGSSVKAYDDYIVESGWMIPGYLIHALPRFFKTKFYEQAVWQWLGMLLVLSLGAAIAMLVFHWTGRKASRKDEEPISKWFFRKLLASALLSSYNPNDSIFLGRTNQYHG